MCVCVSVCDFLETGQTVKENYFLGLGDKIAVRIEEKKTENTEMGSSKCMTIHRAQQAVQAAEQCGLEILLRPAYSPYCV